MAETAKPAAAAIAAALNNKTGKKPHNPHVTRETVESVIVAFILAFLFRAFVAEAFVIPTGSMAPTLMGAHKDTVCEHCGALYQSTASSEFDNDSRASLTDFVALGSTCASCRALNAFDLAGNGNHSTFSGDRILVSKFDYLFRDPDRWDVLVFKFPTDARMNYIKRLVGLPGEHLHIEGGDVYIGKKGSPAIELARKPPDKATAMMQVVSDTKYQADDLVAKGWPSLWQPLKAASGLPPEGSWTVNQAVDNWSATLPAGSTRTQYLRYYHKYYPKEMWADLDSQTKVDIDPYSSSLVTDFLAYNTTGFGFRGDVYQQRRPTRSGWSLRALRGLFSYDPGPLNERITPETRALDVVPGYSIKYLGLAGSLPGFSRPVGFLSQDGMHWVGDLSAEFDVEITGDKGQVSLDAVEFGIHYTCQIDVATGQATWQVTDNDQPLNVFADDQSNEVVVPKAQTSVRGPGRHRLRLANIDDQLMLWVDGSLVSFDLPTTFDSRRFRTGPQRRPYWRVDDPLDAAPLAIGGQGIGLNVKRAQVWRDIYYIAVTNDSFNEYREEQLRSVIASIPDPSIRMQLSQSAGAPQSVIAWMHANPELWDKVDMFSKRGSMDFQLEEGQFFPMGDNSAASSDARVWYDHNYVERRFLIGKALLVFWPHLWKAPVPHPNLPRMGRIR